MVVNFKPYSHYGYVNNYLSYSNKVISPSFGNAKTQIQAIPVNMRVDSVSDALTVSVKNLVQKLKGRFREYTHNIKRTYDHKIVYGLIEKELYGKNSFDSITHDADKLFLYFLGFPHKFVSKFHRKHSTHHPESGKTNLNITSMFVDILASSPEFKPEKKYPLKTFFKMDSSYFDKVSGLPELFIKYNFGENIDLNNIKRKIQDFSGIKGVLKIVKKVVSLLVNG